MSLDSNEILELKETSKYSSPVPSFEKSQSKDPDMTARLYPSLVNLVIIIELFHISRHIIILLPHTPQKAFLSHHLPPSTPCPISLHFLHIHRNRYGSLMAIPLDVSTVLKMVNCHVMSTVIHRRKKKSDDLFLLKVN